MKFINFKYIGIIWLVIASLIAACSNDDEVIESIEKPEPELEILNEEYIFSFNSAGNTAKALIFNTNNDWEVIREESEDDSWLTLFELSGNAGEELKVWIATAENTDPEGRRAYFRLESGGLSEEFIVYQAQKDAVIITDPRAFESLSAGEHMIEVEFGINTGDYAVSIAVDDKDGNWIKQIEVEAADAKTKALVSNTIHFRIEANPRFNLRSGTINIVSKKNSEAKATLNVFQYGLDRPEISVTNKSAFEKIPAEASGIEVKHTATNVSKLEELTIYIEESDKDWISFRKNDEGTAYIVDFTENVAAERSATIALCAASDNSVKDEIKVTQVAADGVVIMIENKDDFRSEISKYEGILVVKYESLVENWDVKVEYPADTDGTDWLKVANSKMPGQIYFTYDENKTLKVRSATIVIYQTNNEAKRDYVVIRQAPGTLIEVVGSLEATLQGHINDGVFDDMQSIQSLELKGFLSDADWTLLKNMTTNAGYKLKSLNLTAVTNTTMKENAFKDCVLLESIIFPGNLRYVSANVCDGCSALKSVKVLEGAEYIDHHAFKNCTKLEEIWLPSTLTYLYGYAFEQCTLLRRIHLKSKPVQFNQVARSEPQPQVWASVFQGSLPRTATLYVPAEYVEYYKNPTPEHVVSRHITDFLRGLTATSPDWTDLKTDSDYLKSGNVRNNFLWVNASTTIVAE